MLVGKQLGPFLIDKELGSGAMGAVFRATNTKNGQKVAVKIVAPGLVANKNALNRFEREIAILKQLNHPNIVRILASGKYSGTPFYVMDYIEGESLDHILARRGRITWEEVITLGRQLCSALQYAHDKGIIHRDLKPSNLMVLTDGSLRLTDFGIAKDTDVTALTAANSTVGTAAYMSPEQCRGLRDLTPKSDLYSLGVMFYELLTGRKPFVAETVLDMFNLHLRASFERPSRWIMEIPIWFDTLICQCLEKEPEKRPFNADMVAQALDMVKDKVAAQVSAGIDAATKRRVDRTSADKQLDEDDKDIARTLLGKKKKKKKAPAWYTKGWFVTLASLLLLGGLAYGAYYVFFTADSADRLYARAEAIMKSDDPEQRRQAVELDGPLRNFLRHYPQDARAPQVRAWMDEADRELCERQMHNRRARFKAEGDWETQARAALDEEDLGRLKDAAERWQEVLRYKDDKDQRPWGLVAEKHLAQLKDVKSLYTDLKRRLALEAQCGMKEEAKNKLEDLAMDAVRAELAEAWPRAQLAWEDLKKKTEPDTSQRTWYLLAAKQYREIAALPKK